MASRVAGPRTLGPPLYIAIQTTTTTETQTATPYPPLATLAVCLRSPHTCMASRGAEASKLGPPLYIAIQTHQTQPQLKPQLELQLQLLRSLRSRSAYGLHAQKEQIDLLATLGELFAPSSLSAVFGSFFISAFWLVPR